MKNLSKHTSRFIKYTVVALFAALTVVSVLMMGRVNINYNISDYLDDSTETKISLDIIEGEFGSVSDVQVMIRDVSAEEAESLCDVLAKHDGVLAVSFSKNDENHYKNRTALVTLLIEGDEYSDTANDVLEEIKASVKEAYSDCADFGGAVAEKATLREQIEGEIKLILVISVCLAALIMLISAKSWLEPVILLISSGVAILINMGTNVFLGEISYITNAVAAILQLALSIDYSIVLLHSYRTRRESADCDGMVMLSSIKDVLRPVSASALTTLAGLLALLFMSFKIGFDIGIVLMKGIVISAVTSMTLFPALLLIFYRLMSRASKKSFILSGEKLCRIAFGGCKVIVPVALAVIIVCGGVQMGNTYTFTDSRLANEEIISEFGENNAVAVVYPSGEMSLEKEEAFIEKLNEYTTSGGKHVLKSFSAYFNTVGQRYDAKTAAQRLNISREDAELLFGMYHLLNGNVAPKLNISELVGYVSELMATDADAALLADESVKGALASLLEAKAMAEREYDGAELYYLMSSLMPEGGQLSPDMAEQLYTMCVTSKGMTYGDKITGREFLAFINANSSHPLLAGLVTGEIASKLTLLGAADQFMSDTASYSYAEMGVKLESSAELFGQTGIAIELTEDKLLGVYTKYAVAKGYIPEEGIPAMTLLEFVAETMDTNELLQAKMPDGADLAVDKLITEAQSASELFLGENYSRMLLTVDLPSESEESSRFVEYLMSSVKDIFGDNGHVAGKTVSTYELATAFDRDNTFISIFTIISVFVIVMAVFCSISVPVLLVAIIQGAIWISMSASVLTGSVFFMSYIVTTCILMGATIDYGILMSSNYVRYRNTYDKKEALVKAVASAMPTVFTSGLILALCGFVVGVVATQTSISTVGILLCRGTLVSVIMITLVLPSVLYLLDRFIIKFSIKKKNK